jgi:hypothetical protein
MYPPNMGEATGPGKQFDGLELLHEFRRTAFSNIVNVTGALGMEKSAA